MPILNGASTANAYPDQAVSGGGGAILTQVYNSRGGWFSVTGASVFCEMQYGTQGSSYWTAEVLLGAGAFAYLDPKCTGVRFRSAVSGSPAQITAQISQGDEPPLSIIALGSVTAVGLSLTFQHNGVAAGSEPILDFEDSASVTFTVTDDVPGTRMKVSAASAVTSVFGRTGAVVAVSGDYTAAQVTNAADKSSASQQTFTAAVASGGGGTAVGSAAGTFIGATGTLASAVGSTAGRCFSATVAGDTTSYRWEVLGDGSLQWGLGAGAAQDVILTHPSSGVLAITTGSNIAIGAITNSSLAGAGALITSGGGGQFVGASLATISHVLGVTGDTQYAFAVTLGGTMTWGPGGATARDTTLARIGVSFLQTTTSVLMTQEAVMGSTTSSIAVTGNYTPNLLTGGMEHILTLTGTTGTFTLNNTATTYLPASSSAFLYVQIVNTASGTATIAYGTQYSGTGTLALTTSLGTLASVRQLFVWVSSASAWHLIGKG